MNCTEHLAHVLGGLSLTLFQRKADELTREVDHWKSVAHHSKQIETKAQDELSAANQRIFELQRLLNEKSVEISTINEQKALLQSQVSSHSC